MSSAQLLAAAVCVGALLIRACVGLHGYSGEGKPPMFGDFEAQRHWMEVTVNLPPTSWYVQGADNDLQYWGLDYPPLSAHLSWVFGKYAQRAHPALVALHASRGHEAAATRAFMRNSVLLSDALVFFPAAVLCASRGVSAGAGRAYLLLQLLATPALVLTDHGHFQYNCVSLGLTLWAVYFALTNRPHACTAAFCLALNFKQMSLYLAPAFFCYLLAGCLKAPSALGKVAAVARLGAVVLGTFCLCWLPFLGDPADATAVLRRVFPVDRHLFEDKVANLWCTLSLLPRLKLKALLSISALLRLTLATTMLALLPPCAMLLLRPSRRSFLLAATACGLAFFLCSYQVHEKHILLPLLPASLLAASEPRLFGWLSAAAAFSLFPLLRRDGQVVPYAVLQLAQLVLPQLSGAPPLPRAVRAAMGVSALGMLTLHALEATVTPPARYPDLHTVAFAAYSCIHFALAYAATLFAMARAASTEQPHTPLDANGTATRPFLEAPAAKGKRKAD